MKIPTWTHTNLTLQLVSSPEKLLHAQLAAMTSCHFMPHVQGWLQVLLHQLGHPTIERRVGGGTAQNRMSRA